MESFTGIWVPLATPFRDGEADLAALQSMARRIASAGVSGFVACGSTGEAATLSQVEQLAVLDAVIDAVPGSPVIMGLAGNNMASLASMQTEIQRRPVAGLLVPPPYYIRPSQAGIIDYFRTVSNAASVPVIIYNVPSRTGVAMELDTIRAIAEHERVVAIKDCAGDHALTLELIADAKLNVLTGDDIHILSTLCVGGAGAIAASAHFRPDLFVQLARLIETGDLAQAREIFYRLRPLIRLLFSESNPAPLKAALSTTEMIADELRPPMQAASAALKARLKQAVAQLNEA